MPAEERDAAEAEELLDLLEYEVIPSWYADEGGLPSDWIARAKASMASVLPVFNAERMLLEYVERMYHPAAEQGRRLAADGGQRAQALGEWKHRARELWRGVALAWAGEPPRAAGTGEPVRLSVSAHLDGLDTDDVRVEAVVETGEGAPRIERFEPVAGDGSDHRYELTLTDLPNGLLHYRVRAYPWHADLAHPYEMGLMSWL